MSTHACCKRNGCYHVLHNLHPSLVLMRYDAHLVSWHWLEMLI